MEYELPSHHEHEGEQNQHQLHQ
jgi:hypothetical protein